MHDGSEGSGPLHQSKEQRGVTWDDKPLAKEIKLDCCYVQNSCSFDETSPRRFLYSCMCLNLRTLPSVRQQLCHFIPNLFQQFHCGKPAAARALLFGRLSLPCVSCTVHYFSNVVRIMACMKCYNTRNYRLKEI